MGVRPALHPLVEVPSFDGKFLGYLGPGPFPGSLMSVCLSRLRIGVLCVASGFFHFVFSPGGLCPIQGMFDLT